jgi:ATP-independent RNA helicase DbpA
MTDTFSALPLPSAMLANLDSLGYQRMTPIQAQSLPPVLAGQDLIAQAKTGSGKTAAFGIGLLNKINPRYFAVQALVLCPTRELADQVTKEIRRLARFADNIKVLTLCGGNTMRPQMASLEHGAHIVVGTPGRIMDHLNRGSLKLEALQTLVLDEADRMVDMGFYDDMVSIAAACPRQRQTLLFSATYPDNIRKQSARFLRNPIEVKVEALHEEGKISQLFFEIDAAERNDAVAKLLSHYRPLSSIAFCNTKQQCRDLVEHLQNQGFDALALYGELEQRERDEVLVRFANRSCSVLVATDVAARGLDITALEAVINVDLTRDPEVHIHRIGRTGRGDETGLALSLVTPAEMRRVEAIEQYQNLRAKWTPLESLKAASREPLLPPMVTLQIQGGRKDKIRPGDILGALTGEAGLVGAQVGKIAVFEFCCYVAVVRGASKQALKRLAEGKIKGKPAKVRMVGA